MNSNNEIFGREYNKYLDFKIDSGASITVIPKLYREHVLLKGSHILKK